ncbi:MAG: hypothetical protein JXQ96_04710 [Cyclobacteriaceae bacterium]
MKYYLFTQVSFIVLSAVCLVLIYFGLKSGLQNCSPETRNKVMRRFTLGMLLWIGVLSVLSLSGFSSNFSAFPFNMMGVLIPPVIFLIFLTRSSSTTDILSHLDPRKLVYIQSFRIPVEILLWLLFLDNLTPVQMTFEGRNFDILVGITALLAAPLFFQKGNLNWKWAIGWNVFGMILLMNILTIAILSFPTPFRYFMNEPANTQVTQFPIIFLPGILVPIAYYMHVLSIKQILILK